MTGHNGQHDPGCPPCDRLLHRDAPTGESMQCPNPSCATPDAFTLPPRSKDQAAWVEPAADGALQCRACGRRYNFRLHLGLAIVQSAHVKLYAHPGEPMFATLTVGVRGLTAIQHDMGPYDTWPELISAMATMAHWYCEESAASFAPTPTAGDVRHPFHVERGQVYRWCAPCRVVLNGVVEEIANG